MIISQKVSITALESKNSNETYVIKTSVKRNTKNYVYI